MPITIKKDDDGIKFYGETSQSPMLTVYQGEKDALLNYVVISDCRIASEVAEAVLIAGLFVQSLKTPKADFKRNTMDVMYLNEVTLETENTKYSARKMLRWVESDKITTVNKRKRIKYRFTKFAYQDERLVILYKPVAW